MRKSATRSILLIGTSLCVFTLMNPRKLDIHNLPESENKETPHSHSTLRNEILKPRIIKKTPPPLVETPKRKPTLPTVVENAIREKIKEYNRQHVKHALTNHLIDRFSIGIDSEKVQKIKREVCDSIKREYPNEYLEYFPAIQSNPDFNKFGRYETRVTVIYKSIAQDTKQDIAVEIEEIDVGSGSRTKRYAKDLVALKEDTGIEFTYGSQY